MSRRAVAAAVAGLISLTVLAPPPAGATVGADGWDRRGLPFVGDARPIVGNFGGDEAADILWYNPGSATDFIWYGRKGVRGTSNMVKRTLHISGRYQPIVGDFTRAGGYDEIFWYAPGPTRDYLWTSVPGTYDFGAHTVQERVDGTFTWAVLRDHRGGKDDVAWVAQGDTGNGRDFVWHFDDSGDGTYQYKTVSAVGTYRLVAGDFDGNGYDDLFLYAPGHKREELWRSAPVGTVSRTTMLVDRSFDLATIRQSGGDDLLFSTRDSAPESIWKHGQPPFGTHLAVASFPVGTRTLSAGKGRVLLFNPDAPESMLTFDGTTATRQELSVDETHQVPYAGDFDGDGHVDILWASPGRTDGSVWYAPAS